MNNAMKTLIVIPARYASKRFPGKPLEQINGISMIRRTAKIAKKVVMHDINCDYVVATEDERVKKHCDSYGINCLMTSKSHSSGSDRILEACIISEKIKNIDYSFVINLQGDSPFTPPAHIKTIIEELQNGARVATPIINLSWSELEKLREKKSVTPFSGTTVIKNKNNNALWFSKNIIPAIRNENNLKKASKYSPVYQHVGLYGYNKETLKTFTKLPISNYEKFEGLEQLRLVENGINIKCAEVEGSNIHSSGIDTPNDLKLAENLLLQYGDNF